MENKIQSFLRPIKSFFGGYHVYNYLKPKRVRLKENNMFSHSYKTFEMRKKIITVERKTPAYSSILFLEIFKIRETLGGKYDYV